MHDCHRDRLDSSDIRGTTSRQRAQQQEIGRALHRNRSRSWGRDRAHTHGRGSHGSSSNSSSGSDAGEGGDIRAGRIGRDGRTSRSSRFDREPGSVQPRPYYWRVQQRMLARWGGEQGCHLGYVGFKGWVPGNSSMRQGGLGEFSNPTCRGFAVIQAQVHVAKG